MITVSKLHTEIIQSQNINKCFHSISNLFYNNIDYNITDKSIVVGEYTYENFSMYFTLNNVIFNQDFKDYIKIYDNNLNYKVSNIDTSIDNEYNLIKIFNNKNEDVINGTFNSSSYTLSIVTDNIVLTFNKKDNNIPVISGLTASFETKNIENTVKLVNVVKISWNLITDPQVVLNFYNLDIYGISADGTTTLYQKLAEKPNKNKIIQTFPVNKFIGYKIVLSAVNVLGEYGKSSEYILSGLPNCDIVQNLEGSITELFQIAYTIDDENLLIKVYEGIVTWSYPYQMSNTKYSAQFFYYDKTDNWIYPHPFETVITKENSANFKEVAIDNNQKGIKARVSVVGSVDYSDFITLL